MKSKITQIQDHMDSAIIRASNYVSTGMSELVQTEKRAFMTSAIVGTVAGVGMCFANGATTEDTTNKIVAAVINMVCSIFMYIGILLLCWGVGQLILAFKNEDADSKSRAMMLIIVSVVLIGFKPFLKTILNSTGVNINLDAVSNAGNS